MSDHACPGKPQLSDFLFGRIDEESADVVQDHVKTCGDCQNTLNGCNAEQDTLLTAFRQGIVFRRGMGDVYRAEHTRLSMDVALKVLSERLTNDPQSITRFNREMKAVGGISHPNIVRATDAGEQDGRHYLAMELIDGCDLHQILKSHGPLRICDACEAIRQALEATKIDHRFDLYSLGCTLYALLCGRPPFFGPKYSQTLKKLMAHDQEQPTEVIASRAEVPVELSRLIDKTLEKSPSDRMSSVAELAAALEPFTEGSDLAALVNQSMPVDDSLDVTSDVSKYVSLIDTATTATVPRPVRSNPSRRWVTLPLAISLLLIAVFGIQFLLRITVSDGKFSIEIESKDLPDNLKNRSLDLPPQETDSPDRNVAEWAIRKNALVDVIDDRGLQLVARPEDIPSGAFVIGKIDFAGSGELTENELARLGELTRLHDLAFQDPHLSETLVDSLARIPNLKLLELRFDLISPGGIERLERLRLATLYLYGSCVTDSDVKAASELSSVLWLGLRGGAITDESLAHVGSMDQLKLLHLLQTPRVSDEGIGHICRLPNLIELFANDTAITDECLPQLANLKRLDWLNLTGTRVSDEGMKQVAKMTWLQRLTLTGTEITDTGVANLHPLTELHHLDVARTKITDEAVDDLSTFANMKDLRVGDRLSADAVERLRTLVPDCKIGP